MTEESVSSHDLQAMTTELVAAYVARNSVPISELPGLIRSVHESLSNLGKPAEAPAPADLKPFVSIRKSVTDDFIISLEDGRKLKSMKRYLTGLGMTPDEYRAKWGLPKDYPMVAPGYAAKRSALAKTMGLGRKAQGAVASAPAPAAEEPAPQPEAESPKKRGRAKKAA